MISPHLWGVLSIRTLLFPKRVSVRQEFFSPWSWSSGSVENLSPVGFFIKMAFTLLSLRGFSSLVLLKITRSKRFTYFEKVHIRVQTKSTVGIFFTSPLLIISESKVSILLSESFHFTERVL